MNGREVGLQVLFLGLGMVGVGLSLLTHSVCNISAGSRLECARPYILLGALALMSGAVVVYYGMSRLRQVSKRLD